ncbi:MAG TPA: hypothetical protein DCP40_02920 [Stenotrophomonas sp.]|nr:hypothetical protein [Stenotrophomonas sp.]
MVAQTRLQLQRCLGRQGQGRCDIPMPRQQRLVPVHRDLGPFMPDGIVVGRVARPMLGNVPDAGEQAADLFAVAGLCHQLSGIDAIGLQSATARQAEFMPPVLSGGVLQMIYSGRIMSVAVAKKWRRLMARKSRRTTLAMRVDAKADLARKRRAIREKYSASVALSRRQKMGQVLKAVFYILGGPLVWILKSGRNR